MRACWLGAAVLLAAGASAARAAAPAPASAAYLWSAGGVPAKDVVLASATSHDEACGVIAARRAQLSGEAGVASVPVFLIQGSSDEFGAANAALAQHMGAATSTLTVPATGLRASRCGALAGASEVASLDALPTAGAAGAPPAYMAVVVASSGRTLESSEQRFLRFTPTDVTMLFIVIFVFAIAATGFSCMGAIQTPKKLVMKGFAKPFKEY